MYHGKSHNLLHHLWLRESNIYPGIRHPVPSHFLYHEKNFYKSITPRLTVQNVDKPYGYLRKFTPDGRMLLAFSHDLKSIDVYEYQGINEAAFLLRPKEYELISSNDNSLLSQHIRQRLFDVLFEREFHIPLITTPPYTRHFLNRECTLFVDNGHYVILSSLAGGSVFPDYLAYHQYSDMFDDTELFDYTFYLVDLRNGCIADILKLDHDFVIVSHNHSVSLYDRTVAILSFYRQCVELLEVNIRDGKFERLCTLGPFGSDLDRDRVLAHQQGINFTFDPGLAMPFSHLKQKILAHMYQEIMYSNCLLERQERLKEFYNKFLELERMIVVKMQLIDNDHILLRYEKRQQQLAAELMDQTSFKFFVFYNIKEQKVLKIYSQDSMELLHIVRNYADDFRNVRPFQVPWNSSSPSSNCFLRSGFDRALQTFPGGPDVGMTRFTSTLPLSSQSFSPSPYLDYSLFDYEDRYVSCLERPKINGYAPIRFYDRKTGQLSFRAFLVHSIDSDSEGVEIERNPRDLVSFIFHPYEPFFISIQKVESSFVTNFHMYNSYTKVDS